MSSDALDLPVGAEKHVFLKKNRPGVFGDPFLEMNSTFGPLGMAPGGLAMLFSVFPPPKQWKILFGSHPESHLNAFSDFWGSLGSKMGP